MTVFLLSNSDVFFPLSFLIYTDYNLILAAICLVFYHQICCWGFSAGSEGRVSAHNAGDPGLIPQQGRALGEGNDNPLRYCCLENSMDRGAWWATVHGVINSQTRLSNFTFFLSFTLDADFLFLYYENSDESNQ